MDIFVVFVNLPYINNMRIRYHISFAINNVRRHFRLYSLISPWLHSTLQVRATFMTFVNYHHFNMNNGKKETISLVILDLFPGFDI